MNLQEKINKRIEQLEAELEQIEEIKSQISVADKHYISDLNYIGMKISTVERCIQELKQLSN